MLHNHPQFFICNKSIDATLLTQEHSLLSYYCFIDFSVILLFLCEFLCQALQWWPQEILDSKCKRHTGGFYVTILGRINYFSKQIGKQHICDRQVHFLLFFTNLTCADQAPQYSLNPNVWFIKKQNGDRKEEDEMEFFLISIALSLPLFFSMAKREALRV